MKENVIDEIKSIVNDSRTWVKIQLEYAKLTTAEKFTILTSTFVLGATVMLLSMVIVILLALALVDIFRDFLGATMAYVTVAGILLVLTILIWAFRRPLIFNPLARYITRLFLENKNKE